MRRKVHRMVSWFLKHDHGAFNELHKYSSPSLIRTTRDRRNRFDITGIRINRGPEVEMFIHLSLNDG